MVVIRNTFYVGAGRTLSPYAPSAAAQFEYDGLSGAPIQFSTPPFEAQTEMTGHPVAHLFMSLGAFAGRKDFDVFVTLRHIAPDGAEVVYTGTSGMPASAGKGWLRASMRFVDDAHPLHTPYLPYQPCMSVTVAYPKAEEVIELVVEVWSVHFVLERGARLVLEVSPKDTPGTDIFTSFDEGDRSKSMFGGVVNRIHDSDQYQSRLVMPFASAAGAAPGSQTSL